MKKDKKRLSVDIYAETHKWIKKVALEKNITISQWIDEAIEEKQIKDKDLGF